jgi:hypothetical protein
MADVFRIKRRSAAGAAGAPASLAASEIAYNEKDDTLYYGKGNSGGLATSILPIGGPGAFDTKNAPAVISVGDAPPSSPVNGQLWYQSNGGGLFIYFTDANTSQWVQIGGAEVN